jgi:hypothetical protein
MTPTLLRRVLAFDALTCAAMGLLLLLATAPLVALLGLPHMLLVEAGAILLAFALFILWAMRSLAHTLWPLGAVIAGNLLWVLASFALLAGPWLQPTALGIAFVSVQALAVAGLAGVEWLGLARQRAAA